MSEIYGYKLASFENCKNKRAVYKCLSKACCIHDESYYVCNQLEGDLDVLLRGLSRITSPKVGLTFSAKMCLSGQYEGRTIVYELDQYPFNCIGPVRFLWKYDADSTSLETKIIWIWSHPSVAKQIENQLIKSFDFQPKPTSDCNYFQSVENVKLKSLKEKLVRFKLLGPLATAVLDHVLKPIESEDKFYLNQADIWTRLN
jgi:hypothetical protein